MKSVFTFLFFSLYFISFSSGQISLLDTSFNHDGIAWTNLGNASDHINSIKFQTDGKIVVAGIRGGGNSDDFALVRFNTDGSLDNSFGISGRIIGNWITNEEYKDVIIQTDGKIVAGGYSSINDDGDFLLARYDSSGVIDSSFGVNGYVLSDFTSSYDFCFALALQSDGKIIAGGFTDSTPTSYLGSFALIRYNTDGLIDTTFGNGGRVITSHSNFRDYVHSIHIQDDGKIIAGGLSDFADFVACRYDMNGILDSTFNSTGKLILSGYKIESMIIQPDRTFLLGGTRWDNTTNDNFLIAKLDSSGVIDSAFGNNGSTLVDFYGQRDQGRELCVQADGKIILVGEAENASISSGGFSFARLLDNGSPDLTLNGTGKFYLELGVPTFWSHGESVAIQNDGKIVFGGSGFHNLTYGADFTLIRFQENLSVGILNFSDITNEATVFPNPINNNSETFINYDLVTDENLSLTLYNTQGELIQEIISNEHRAKGSHTEVLNFSKRIDSGNYLLQISNGKNSRSIRFVIL